MKKIVFLIAGLFFFAAAVNAQQVPKVQINRSKTADRQADSVSQFIMGKDTSAKKLPTKKPYRKVAKKPAEKTEAKQND